MKFGRKKSSRLKLLQDITNSAFIKVKKFNFLSLIWIYKLSLSWINHCYTYTLTISIPLCLITGLSLTSDKATTTPEFKIFLFNRNIHKLVGSKHNGYIIVFKWSKYYNRSLADTILMPLWKNSCFDFTHFL